MRFQPQDEVKAFETRASKSVKKGIPGLAPVVAAPPKPKAEKKKDPVAEVTASVAAVSVTPTATPSSSSSTAPPESVDPVVAAAKKLKALKKKLREIIEISQKKREDLTPEQVEKLSKKEEVEAEIARLEV